MKYMIPSICVHDFILLMSSKSFCSHEHICTTNVQQSHECKSRTNRRDHNANSFFALHLRQGSVVKDQTGEKSAFGLSKGLPNIYNWEKV
jgi:hypothetical protein